MANRGVFRHPNFDRHVQTLSDQVPRIEEGIAGALWSLARNPDGEGVYLQEYGVWQARLVILHSPADVLIFYTFNPRYLYALCAKLAED